MPTGDMVNGIKKGCPICGDEYMDYSKNAGKMACSKECYRVLVAQNTSPEKRLTRLVDLRLNVLRVQGTEISKEEREIITEKLLDGRCEICGEKKTIRGLHVDHDHTNNKYRGVLCAKCNLLLGMAGDNIEILMNTIAYLQINSGKLL
jgi:hypothetical protein